MMKVDFQDYQDAGTVIFDCGMIDQLTRGNIIDAPVTLLCNDPPIWILPTAMQQNGDIFLSHTLIKGDLEDLHNAEYCVVNEHQLFEIPDRLKETNTGRHWITNLLRVDGGILAFLHSEYTAEGDFFGMPSARIDGVKKNAPGTSRIGLAWLPQERIDNGKLRLNYLGHIAGSSSGLPHFNVCGTPVFVNNSEGVEYLNVMFSDTDAKLVAGEWTTSNDLYYVSQARAPLSDVIKRAKQGQLTQWKKRNGSEWTDALTGASTGILPAPDDIAVRDLRIRNGAVLVHSDVHYHKDSGKFLLIGYCLKNENQPTSIVTYTSDDGINWNFTDVSLQRRDAVKGWSYVSIIERPTVSGPNGLFVLIGWEYGSKDRCLYKLKLNIEEV